jgi:phage-related minor tail protein
MDVLNKGFEDFFSNLAQGTADVEDLFKRMAQSIIAELLKIWAKKYIIDTLVRFFNGGSSTANATGNAFDSGAVVPFARGGVISQPIMFPMALAGEAGPEAIVPLRRTASGDLGVQAQQQPLQITINNNAPNVAVATRQTPEGLEITVEQVKAALVADVLRGGNDFASAAESAWGLSRGHAAAF